MKARSVFNSSKEEELSRFHCPTSFLFPIIQRQDRRNSFVSSVLFILTGHLTCQYSIAYSVSSGAGALSLPHSYFHLPDDCFLLCVRSSTVFIISRRLVCRFIRCRFVRRWFIRRRFVRWFIRCRFICCWFVRRRVHRSSVLVRRWFVRCRFVRRRLSLVRSVLRRLFRFDFSNCHCRRDRSRTARRNALATTVNVVCPGSSPLMPIRFVASRTSSSVLSVIYSNDTVSCLSVMLNHCNSKSIHQTPILHRKMLVSQSELVRPFFSYGSLFLCSIQFITDAENRTWLFERCRRPITCFRDEIFPMF